MRIPASLTLSALTTVAAAALGGRPTDAAELALIRLPPTNDNGAANLGDAIQTNSQQVPEARHRDIYNVYKDVRYGAKPRRFRRAMRTEKFDPTPVERNNQICPQAVPAWSSGKTKSVSVGNQTEDCLFLDVYVTKTAFDRARAKEDGTANMKDQLAKGAPVVVWFHPGNFVSGSKNDVDPDELIGEAFAKYPDQGIVVVSFNYRLGMLGWMPVSGDSDIVPNVGLWDQRLALEWIRDHIAWYGGDPARVTVAGDQSGAASIIHHMTAFSGEGNAPQFSRAILNNPFWNPSPADDVSEKLVSTANRFQDRKIFKLEDLDMLSPEDVQSVNQKIIQGLPPGRHTFGPILDRSIVSAYPFAVLRDDALTYQKRAHWETTDHEQIDPGASRQRFGRKPIPFMVGTHSFRPGMTSDELPEFEYVQKQDTNDFNQLVRRTFPHMRDRAVKHLVEDLYPSQRYRLHGREAQNERMKHLLHEGMMECNSYALSQAYPDQAFLYTVRNVPVLKGTKTGAIQTRDRQQSPLTADAARNSTNALVKTMEPTCFLCKSQSALHRPLSWFKSGADAPFPWMLSFIYTGDPNKSPDRSLDWPMFVKGLALAFQASKDGRPQDARFPAEERERCDWWMELKERPSEERHGNYIFKHLVNVSKSEGHPGGGWTGWQGTMPVALVAALTATVTAMA